jgi:hypothetical protein
MRYPLHREGFAVVKPVTVTGMARNLLLRSGDQLARTGGQLAGGSGVSRFGRRT